MEGREMRPKNGIGVCRSGYFLSLTEGGRAATIDHSPELPGMSI